MTTTYSEAKVRRATNGRFTFKEHREAPELDLATFDEVDERMTDPTLLHSYEVQARDVFGDSYDLDPDQSCYAMACADVGLNHADGELGSDLHTQDAYVTAMDFARGRAGEPMVRRAVESLTGCRVR